MVSLEAMDEETGSSDTSTAPISPSQRTADLSTN
jgi:hypothetical protein